MIFTLNECHWVYTSLCLIRLLTAWAVVLFCSLAAPLPVLDVSTCSSHYWCCLTFEKQSFILFCLLSSSIAIQAVTRTRNKVSSSVPLPVLPFWPLSKQDPYSTWRATLLLSWPAPELARSVPDLKQQTDSFLPGLGTSYGTGVLEPQQNSMARHVPCAAQTRWNASLPLSRYDVKLRTPSAAAEHQWQFCLSNSSLVN